MPNTTKEQFLRGNKTIAGAYGTLWVDNEKIAEVKSFNAKVIANRSTVQLGLSEDSKIQSVKGEGTYTVHKVYSRAKKYVEMWNKGKDTRGRITSALKDPDAVDGKEERVSIDNVWVNEVVIGAWTRGEGVEEETPFGFTPEDVEFEEAI